MAFAQAQLGNDKTNAQDPRPEAMLFLIKTEAGPLAQFRNDKSNAQHPNQKQW